MHGTTVKIIYFFHSEKTFYLP